MIDKIQTILKIPELKKKIFFTIAILFVCRVGTHIPIPGINLDALAMFFSQMNSGMFGMFDLFTGGAFQKAAVFALGVMPYISASIIIQLLGTVFPMIAKMQKEEDGRRKMTKFTRYGTVFIAAAEAWGVAIFLEKMGSGIVGSPGFGFRMVTMLTMVTGTLFLMWLGEQISNRGLGNGLSMIISIGILARFPDAVLEEFIQLQSGNREIVLEIILWGGMLAAIAAVIMLTKGARNISVHYAKRQSGGKVFGGQVAHLPLKVNLAGVMPIIFAQSIMFVPNTVAQLLPDGLIVKDWISAIFAYHSYSYMAVYMLVIVFFTYFYTAIMFNPEDVSNNIKQAGGFIPGVKPGKDTAQYIDSVLSRITLPGSLFLGLIAITPNLIVKFNPSVSWNFASFFGGTSLIIVVGVSLDTLQQIESYLLMHHYDGFMTTGKVQGRSLV